MASVDLWFIFCNLLSSSSPRQRAESVDYCATEVSIQLRYSSLPLSISASPLRVQRKAPRARAPDLAPSPKTREGTFWHSVHSPIR